MTTENLEQAILNQAPDTANQIIEYAKVSWLAGSIIMLLILITGLVLAVWNREYKDEFPFMFGCIIAICMVITIPIPLVGLFEATYYPKAYLVQSITGH